MSTKVVHGEGKPRIIVQLDASLYYTGSVTEVDLENNILTLDEEVTFNDNLLNRLIRCINGDGEYTYAKITGYDQENLQVVVDKWSNLFPTVDGYIIGDYVIDLPYCQNNLVERFVPDFGPAKKIWNSGRLYRTLRGFYYKVLLDYSRYTEKELLMEMERVYDKARTEPFLFYPRSDNPEVYYLCEIEPESELQFAQLQRHQGHRLVQFNFYGVERLDKVPLSSNLDTIIGLGNSVMSDEFVVEE
jgi:hypothetical protein